MPGIADELAAGYASAWNVHDTDAMTLLFHEDGTFVNVNGTYEKGPGLLTWCEIWCDVENSKSFRSSRNRRIFPGHRL